MASSSKAGGPGRPKNLATLLNDENVRAVLYQILVMGGVLLLGWYLVNNTLENLARQNIATGYGFLDLEASFGISESLIDYSPADNYGRALLVGLLNTIKVSVVGIVLATVIGTVMGIARLSDNWILRKFAGAYVDAFRNVPVLLQLFFWYAVINSSLPNPKQALNPFGDFFLTNRGFFMPVPAYDNAYMFMAIALVLGGIAWYMIGRWANQRQATTGVQFPVFRVGLGVTVGLMALAYLIGGAPTELDAPVLKGFNFRGGAKISPEFAAVLIGLTVYTSTFIAEVVRAGILAVPKGQWEAADSLGLKRGISLRKIILPQAMRVVIPPLTNQYLNLTKNSSLAVAVGYPELVSISNTTMNQTGQAIEAISIFMSIYLSLSLITSLFMNWFNKKMALVER